VTVTPVSLECVVGLAAAVPHVQKEMTVWVDFYNPTYLITTNGNVENSSPYVILLLHVTFLLAFTYSIIFDCVKWCVYVYSLRQCCQVPAIGVTDVATTRCNVQVTVDGTRGDKQPSNTFNTMTLTKQSYSVKSFDDGSNFNESAFGSSRGSSGYYTGGSNYSDYSYRSRIVGGGNVKITRSMLQGTESVADKGHDVYADCHGIKKSEKASLLDNDNGFRKSLPLKVEYVPDKSSKNESNLLYPLKQKDSELVKQLQQRESPIEDLNKEHSLRQKRNESIKLLQEKLPSCLPEPKRTSTGYCGYNKPTYSVLIGNSVKVYSTNIFASFPQSNKFLVKERHQDSTGITKVKLTLKSTDRERYRASCYYQSSHCISAACTLSYLVCIY